jgi:glycosyltransferase involved in cell wall biosynthesis
VTDHHRNLVGVREAEQSVAVVLTTFNDTDFLRHALTSVVSQTQPASEIIVVDDGSDESPAPILADFPGVVLLRKQNGGLASARNAGLHEARSRFITFLDADDRFEPNAIAAGLACFATQPEAVMVYGGHRRIGADGNPLGFDSYQASGKDPYADLLAGNIVGMHAAVLYRRDVLLAVGGFDVGLSMCEDYDIYLRLAREYCIASHAAIVAEYRLHGRNMSSDSGRMLQAVLTVHDRHRQQTSDRRIAWRKGRRNWKSWYTGSSLWNVRNRTLSVVKRIAKSIDRASKGRLYRLLRRHRRSWPPPVGSIDFGHLGTTRPISLNFGFDRGTPIDRYYVEQFLNARAHDIKGHVLEVGDDTYSRRYGAAAVSKQDVLHVDPRNANATIVGDLSAPDVLPDDAFDCIVLTQTLQLIFELKDAVMRLHAALKPGGVLLLTVPGISQIDRQEWANAWCWAFTARSVRRLFEATFAPDALEIESHGNVFAAVAYLSGAALEDIDTAKLQVQDPAYPLILTLRAQKH